MGTGRRYRRVGYARRGTRRGKYRRVMGVQGHHGATEMKFVDYPYSTLLLTPTTGTIALLNGLQYGAAPYNRIGNRIRMKSLHLRGFILVTGSNAAANTQGFPARIIVFYDRQTNGANPSITDLLMAYTQAGATTSNTLDGIRMDNRDRFLILRDSQLTMPPVGVNGGTPAANTAFSYSVVTSGSDQGSGCFSVDMFIPLKGLEAHYKASTGLVGDLATGGLFVLGVSSDASAGSPAYALNFTSRLRFYD